jgi:hypothetical protein
MMSGASFAATVVARLSQYPFHSLNSPRTVMFGCCFWNRSMTCWVRLCRSSDPHQVKRNVTGSADKS